MVDIKATGAEIFFVSMVLVGATSRRKRFVMVRAMDMLAVDEGWESLHRP